MIHENIKTYLLTATVAAIVGTRIFIGKTLPKMAVYPALNLFNITSPQDHVTDIASPRMQFSCWGRTLTEAWGICSALKTDLIRFKGDMGGQKIRQVVYIDAWEVEFPDPKKFLVPVDFKFIYREDN